MDSGNSGSMQSSSGGDEEYDSRTESISPFLNPSGNHFGSFSNPPLSHPPTLFYPPPSNNLDNFSNYNHDLVWSRGLRSEPNYTEFTNLTALSSSSSSSQSLLGAQGLAHGSSSMPLQGNSGQQSDQTNVVKKSKKRTRASRRAPTTVLTTDTTNFRQMVQEFTGIPTAPFSGSPYSRRLDLFTTASSMGSRYPLRPSIQKVHLSPSFSSPSFLSSSMIDSTAPITTSIVGASNNYQLPSDLGLSKQPSYLMNMQNPFSLPPSLMNEHILGTKSQGNSTFVGLGTMNHEQVTGNVSGIQRHGSSDFNPGKGLENVSSRGEGTVDSWICPSD